MSWLLSFLPFSKTPERELAPEVPTDEVLPVHLFDSTSMLRDCLIVWLIRFEEVLDPEVLNASLCRVFQRDGWRKLGGRFRQREDGKLEIRIPCPFTDQRPPVHYTKQQFSIRMEEHPLASKLPRATGSVETFMGPRAFNSLSIGPGAPTTFADLTRGDTPQFSLHVNTFTNGTIVSVVHSHMTADLGTFSAVVNAWCRELEGRPEHIPPLEGLQEDPLKGLYDPPAEHQHVLAKKKLTGWRLAYWGIWALLTSKRAPPQSRVLCIPKNTMESLMAHARDSITRNEGGETVKSPSGRDPYFVSEGDVVAALATRVNAETLPPGSTRNIVTMMALDPRGRVPSVLRQDAAYAGNSPTVVFLECAADKAIHLPLGDLALLSRRAIEQQATESQMKAYTSMCAESVRKTNSNVLFGDKDMSFQLISNWMKARLFDSIDFSPAIVKEAVEATGQHRTAHKRGHPTYLHSGDPGSIEGPFMLQIWAVMGKDFAGNMYFSLVLPEVTWTRLLAFLEDVGKSTI